MATNYFQQLVLDSDIQPIDFKSLDPSLHEDPDQIRRRINAQKIKTDNITIHEDYYEIIGSSGDVYKVTLNICSCFDFASRGLPCKHIYRFALDHNIIEAFPKIKPKNASIFAKKIDQEIEHFHSYYKQGLISAEKFVKIVDAIKRGK
jgi:hypothetical protein